ncbi:MAG: PD-(D/E)XK nuclease family protein [Desulfobacteraceae bacterium]|nr:MAG: PD-(D/E)XK nuclease family protein [Desulfobacteraceae bacterium]
MEDNLARVIPEESAEVQLHFSYSQLSTYLICPMKYAHSYIWATPWESKPIALPFGKAVHKSAEAYYRALMETGEIIPVDKIIETFTAVFDNDIKNSELKLTMKEGETVGGLRDQGIELLRLFHKEIRPQKIAAVEFPFSVTIPDVLNGGGDLPIRLIGYLDLVERDQQNTYLVGELKTSAQKFSSVRLEHDLQATTYSYVMSRLRLATTEKSCLIRYDVLIKTKKIQFEHYFVTRSEGDHQRLIHLMNHVLRAIELKVFYRNTDWQCGDCQFKKACLG